MLQQTPAVCENIFLQGKNISFGKKIVVIVSKCLSCKFDFVHSNHNDYKFEKIMVIFTQVNLNHQYFIQMSIPLVQFVCHYWMKRKTGDQLLQ